MRIAGYGGAPMVFLMWLSLVPSKDNPVLDQHVVYLVVFLGIVALNPSRQWGGLAVGGQRPNWLKNIRFWNERSSYSGNEHMIKRIINGRSKSITSAALIIGLLSLSSRFLGMFRDRILAGQFGAGETLDMYYAAFRIPDFFFNLIVVGALSAGFIPIFTSFLDFKKDGEPSLDPDGWLFVNNVLNILMLLMAIISGVLAALAPWLMPIITPGFGQEEIATTVYLTQIMFLSPIFLGLSGIFGGILQSFRMFFVYSFAPIMYNIGIIVGALVFTRWWGINGLAYGVVFGAMLHMAIQMPQLWRLGYKYRPYLNWKSAEIKIIGRTMVPRVLNLAVNQMNLLVITVIASTLTAGSITIFNFANNLQSIPLGVFGISFALAAFPTLSSLANKNDTERFVRSFSLTVRQILFFTVPASVLLVVLRAQIVRVILGTGKFDWEDTVLTLESVEFFAFSLFAQSLIPLLIRAFWAKNNTKTPFLVAAVSAVVNIALALPLAKIMGVVGLALAFTLSSIFNLVFLAFYLKKEFHGLDEQTIMESAVKIVFASLASGAAAYVALYLVGPIVDMHTFLGVFMQGSVAGIMGLAVFAAISAKINLPEFASFRDSLKRKLFKTRVVVTEITNDKQ